MCLRHILPLCLGLSVAAPLHALPEGSYSGSGGNWSLEMRISGGTVEIYAGSPNCAGGGDGVLRQVGETTWHALLPNSSQGDICVVQIDDMGDAYALNEIKECGSLHGARCRFTGRVAK